MAKKVEANVRRPEPPVGVSVTDETLKDEVQDKITASNKSSSMEITIEKMKEQEKKLIKPRSTDLEVIKDISHEALMKAQDEGLLYGYDPKTKTACLLKKTFVEKVKTKEE